MKDSWMTYHINKNIRHSSHLGRTLSLCAHHPRFFFRRISHKHLLTFLSFFQSLDSRPILSPLDFGLSQLRHLDCLPSFGKVYNLFMRLWIAPQGFLFRERYVP